ncbi:PAS domain-containing protein [Hyalangium minutum]|uniref:histidine kinase n=1 Tax=Hyalangium minutum TaxID=394096 RepID=A0A085WWP1_9BACT|nr:PAS domain-containing protein [Hyalangium minutum]KFE72104.1 PAS/PAC domain protein [Hyalangium minutum]
MSPTGVPAPDLPTLAKAVRAINQEFSLPELQRTVLRVIQEHTPAPYAALLGFHEARGWVIQCQTEGEHRALHELPTTVIHGARRTLEPVVLSEASQQAPYCDDVVVRAKGLRSVICWPLTHRGVQHGLLYLEHAHASHAFDGVLSVIELLAAQAAVALDNARVHQHLAEQSHAHEVSRREVSATRQYLQDFIDHSPAAIYLKDREGRYLMVNGRFETFYGLSRHQILGKKDSDLLPLENARPLMENDQQVMRSGTTHQFEEQLPFHDGVHTFISAKFPLRSAMGGIEGLCGVSTDITDRKRAEAALQRANEELEQRVAERTEQLHAAQQELLDRARHAGMAEIANSILHNMGNALTGITVSSTVLRERILGVPIASLGRAAALMTERSPEELVTFLTQDERGKQLPEYMSKLHTRLEEERQLLLEECNVLATKIEHATSVIATQQNYARARIRLSEKARLRDLLEDAVRLCAVGDHIDKILQREYCDEEPEFYDRHVIVQILVNFISNAKNAVRERPDNTQPRITLSVRQDPTQTAVAVSDNGVGFDASVKPRLFTHGFTTRAKGHGFGLHSSALSAQALGGRIEANSDGLGLGARFELILPRGSQNADQ